MVVGVLTAEAGEPLAGHGFAGHPAAPRTVSTPLALLQQRLHGAAVGFVGARGRGKAKGTATCAAERRRDSTALPEPQRRTRLKRGGLQLGQLAAQGAAGHAAGRRSILRKHAAEARQAWPRLQAHRPTWPTLVAPRHAQGAAAPRGPPAAGWRPWQAWGKRPTRTRGVTRRLAGRGLTVDSAAAAPEQTGQRAGCSVLETDVPAPRLDTHTAQARSKDRAHVEPDVGTLQTGVLAGRPLFVRQESRPRGPVVVGLLALKLSRALPQRLAAACGPTQDEPQGGTVPDAFAALQRL